MRKTQLLRTLLLCSVAPLLGVATQAAAQTAASSTASPASSTSGNVQLQDVVVTAERKAENLQKTAAAVTVISGAKIAAQGETNLEEIVRDVPGVNITSQPGGMNANIRGQGADLPPGSSQGAVAPEFDGVYNMLAQGGVSGYYDIQRVEVLPGPQGTLYGVNADGGVINVISNDPVLGKYSGSATVNIGNYHLYHGELAVNLPVSDVFALRVAGVMTNRTSYYTPAEGDQVGQSVRAKALYHPFEGLTAKLTYQLDHIGGMGPGGQRDAYIGGTVNNDKNPWTAEGFSDFGAQPTNNQTKYYMATYSGNVAYNLGDFAVLNVLPAYSRMRQEQQNCQANGAGPGQPPAPTAVGTCSLNFTEPFYQISSEERLNSAPGAKLQWDLGAYYWKYSQTTYGELGGFGAQGPAYAQVQGATSTAGFGEVTYSVLPDLRLIGGARETQDYRFKNQGGTQTGPNSYVESAIQGVHFHHFDYKAGVEYDLTPSSMEYFTASTGYRPGGFNVNSNGSLSTYQNEVITSYELGSKNRFLGNRLQVNGDVFYYNEHNYQLFDFFQLPGCNGPSSQSNPACSAPTLNLQGYVYGAEFQSRYNLTPNDQVSLSFAILDAKYSNQQDAVCDLGKTGGCYVGANNPVTGALVWDTVAGEEQPHAPPISGNFSYNHTFDLASGASITAGGEIYFSDRFYVHPEETVYALQPTYWTQGLNVSYAPANGKWSANAYVHNLSNYAVKDSSTPFTSLGEPRTFGVSMNYHW